jgi:hypothetical protein
MVPLISVSAGALLLASVNANPMIDMGWVNPKSTTTPPVILISNPQNGTTQKTSTIMLDFIVTPPQDQNPDHPYQLYGCYLKEAYYLTSWQLDKVYVFKHRPDELVSNVWENIIALKGLPQGINSVTVTAVWCGRYFPYTNYGTYAQFSISGSSTVNFAVDLKPLRIGIQAPYPQAYTASDVALAFTTNEETSRLQYCLDGQGNVTIAGNTTLTGLPAGSHNVTVYGWDAFGNPGNSETTTFTIAKPVLFPTSQLVAASAVASAAAICLALVVYFTKRKKKQASQQKITM